jgi:serine/threonine protein kinase
MAPEQFQGKAVFASDIYSIGVSMYQMLTGDLPYQTPAPSDLDRLMRGDLVSPPRLRNSKIPRALNDIVMKALAPEIGQRYQRASELLEDLLAVRLAPSPRRGTGPSAVAAETPAPSSIAAAEEMPMRLRARETPQPRFCWHCRKPLHARADRCPFCGETQ